MTTASSVKTEKSAVSQHRTSDQFWVGATLAITALSVVAALLYLILAYNWLRTPFVGTMLTPMLVVAGGRPTTDAPWNALGAGLRVGDQLTKLRYCATPDTNCTDVDLSGVRSDYMGTHAALDGFLGARQIGDQLEVFFERAFQVSDTDISSLTLCEPGTPTQPLVCRAVVTLQEFPAGDFIAYFIVPYLTGVFMLVTGIILFSLRYNQPAARIAVAAMVLAALFSIGLFDAGTTGRLIMLWCVVASLLGGVFALLGMVFPTPMTLVYRHPWVRVVPVIIGALFGVFALVQFLPDFPGAVPETTSSFAAVIGVVIFSISMFYQRQRAVSSLGRNQSNIVIAGLLMTAVPVGIWAVVRIAQTLFGAPLSVPFSVETTMPFMLLPILSITYAFLQFRRIDTDRVISQGITYAIMLAALVAGYFMLVFGASLFTTQSVSASDPFLIAVTIFIIAVLFLPVRGFLQTRIDEIYYRLRRNYQHHLEGFTQRVASVPELARITADFRKTLDDAIAPTNVLIFLLEAETKEFVALGAPRPETDMRFAADSGLARVLRQSGEPLYLASGRPWPADLRSEKARLNVLKTAVVAALPGSDQLNGFVCVGAARSDKLYAYEELRFIASLAGQMAVAVERTQVIGSLRRRVRELDVLSQVSQAVNFTIEEDALLELISAQTGKLIDADYFYIVLRDQAAEQLYFAFFVEEEERYKDKEDRRWPMGRGLYSEVVKSAKPIRVDSYKAAMDERNAPLLLMSETVLAWMGVPLIAGPRVLGVLAVATDEPGKTYNDDQLKIFSDIAALAATSIDKARLFAETERRARQLAALNDISNRLVATESDVEKLLEIITSSAVEILNAEAGSLFLMAEDSSGDLVFRVVIGGSGKELVGSRLPAGKGLVGEVARRGKPIVQNEARQDLRVADVSKGKFVTSSLIAVPLIAKNRVIGVLEVLNRKDGTPYGDDDVTLLTTFAGQAAVAIENARLFQVTESQLGKRVAELEALERIDVELNRTLDLGKVSQTALRWAIAQTGASAGIIGLVQGEPPMLQVLAMHGYLPDEYPAGTAERRWPLDKGIVSRVMRTRQPDLVTDTSIDRDYIPSLREAKSQITIPMITGNEITAMLVLESDRKDQRLGLLDLQFAQRLAEHASIAIENARLTEAIRRSVESKSEFMGFAAHELKNPLTSIKGYAATMLNESMFSAMNDDMKKNAIRIIQNNAERMQTIIGDLRDAAASEAGKLQMNLAPTSFRNVVVETLRPFQKQLEDKAQELVNTVPEDLPDVLGDPTRLIQVLTNLVSNAHKYSPPEATITIHAEVVASVADLLEKHAAARKDRTRRVGHYLYCTVSDTGIGMTPEDVAKLFREQYFRSDNPLAREQPGTGLGMMITWNIIQLHHGEIWVTSELNVGTTFHILLPLAPAPEKKPQAEPASD